MIVVLLFMRRYLLLMMYNYFGNICVFLIQANTILHYVFLCELPINADAILF